MTLNGQQGGRNRPGAEGRRNRYAVAGVLIGVAVACALIGLGAGRLQAAGLGLLCLGAAMWFGSMAPASAAAPLDETTRRQRYRSRAIALGLGALVVIFYVATLVRLGPNALRKDLYSGQTGAAKNVVIEDKSQGNVGKPGASCKQAGTC